MKHERYFQDFLNKTVNLNDSRIDNLNGHVEAITNFLKGKLVGYKKYSQQGSYAHQTIIKPVRGNDEFDADVLIFIKDADFSPSSFKVDYVNRVYDTFKDNGTYKDKIKKNTRCVTIDYAGDFHLDIVPCIEYEDVCYICNGSDKRYEKTDGDGYKGWVANKNKIIEGNNFRKTIRLLKFLRDHKDNFSVKSILLTTIVGNRVNENDTAFSDLPTTLKILSSRVNKFLQQNEKMPIVENPVLSEEDFNRHWDEKKYANFRDKFDSYNKRIDIAFDEKNHNKSVEAWRKLFGDDFGEMKNDDKKSALGAVAATKPYASYD